MSITSKIEYAVYVKLVGEITKLIEGYQEKAEEYEAAIDDEGRRPGAASVYRTVIQDLKQLTGLGDDAPL